MEATCSSETSIEFQRTTRPYIPEDSNLHNHRCVNLTPYNVYLFSSVEIIRICDISIIPVRGVPIKRFLIFWGLQVNVVFTSAVICVCSHQGSAKP
jgi:hypothetical protein